MASSRPVLLALLSVLWSCGGEQPNPRARDALRAVATCTPTELAAALQTHDGATLVVAFDLDAAEVQAAVDAADRAQPPFVVLIGGTAAEGALPDAWIQPRSGAEAAVDLALLACTGTAPTATRYEIGARTWTEANRAAGGDPTLAPADALLALLRMQRGDALDTSPSTGANYAVALLADEDGPTWQAAALAEVRAAAARYPQLRLVERSETAGDVLADARAILLASQDRERIQSVAQAAAERADGAIPVFALDPLMGEAKGACSIGCTPRTVAQAAAARIRALLPEGGDLLICAPRDPDARTEARREALATALGLEPASLR